MFGELVLSLSLALALSLSLSRARARALCLSLSLSLSRARALSLSLSLSLLPLSTYTAHGSALLNANFRSGPMGLSKMTSEAQEASWQEAQDQVTCV